MGPLEEILGLLVMCEFSATQHEGFYPFTLEPLVTNNLDELEGLIWGFECLSREGWIPTIIEGDLNILIQMDRHLANERTSVKISSS